MELITLNCCQQNKWNSIFAFTVHFWFLQFPLLWRTHPAKSPWLQCWWGFPAPGWGDTWAVWPRPRPQSWGEVLPSPGPGSSTVEGWSACSVGTSCHQCPSPLDLSHQVQYWHWSCGNWQNYQIKKIKTSKSLITFLFLFK